jgi:hypothetical protein
MTVVGYRLDQRHGKENRANIDEKLCLGHLFYGSFCPAELEIKLNQQYKSDHKDEDADQQEQVTQEKPPKMRKKKNG